MPGMPHTYNLKESSQMRTGLDKEIPQSVVQLSRSRTSQVENNEDDDTKKKYRYRAMRKCT